MALNRSILWTDFGGNTTISLIRTAAGAGTIETQMLAVMNADWVNEWEGTLNINGSPAPSNAQYPGVNSQATLVFGCADGTSARLDLIAPKLGIFLADGVTVDPTMITSLITACVGSLLSSSLSPATAYQSGILRRRP